MRRGATSLLTLVLGLGWTPAPRHAGKPSLTVLMPAVVDEHVLPLVAIYYEDWGRGSRVFGPQIILAIWRNGRVVWSRDALKGGPPYRTGRVARGRLRKLLEGLDASGIFKDPTLNDANFGPDSQFITIAIADGRRRLNMASWHEVYEANSDLVATSAGLEPLDGRDRAAVLAAEPESYRRYRRLWGEVRHRLTSLLPRDGEAAGPLKFKLHWLTGRGRRQASPLPACRPTTLPLLAASLRVRDVRGGHGRTRTGALGGAAAGDEGDARQDQQRPRPAERGHALVQGPLREEGREQEAERRDRHHQADVGPREHGQEAEEVDRQAERP